MVLRQIATAALLSLALLSCDSTTNTAPGVDSQTSGLHGSVLLQDGKGLAGARVRLQSTGAVTVTGSDGSWSFPSKSTAVGIIADSGTDSVTVSKDSQVIASQAVTGSELPPLYLVQRDLYGSLSAPVSGHTYTITAKLTLPDGSVKDIGLWHNAVAKSFSGFIYVVAGSGVQNYSVQVQVYDSSDSAVVGISPSVPFTSAAGDILIPAFGYVNVGYRLVLSAPTDSIVFKTGFPVSVSVSDTTITGIGLHAPYQYSYALGDGPWVSGKPTSLVLDTALVRSPVIKVKVIDATGGVLLDSVPVVVRARVSRTYIWVRPTYVSVYDSVLKQYITKATERPTTVGQDTSFWQFHDGVTTGVLLHEHGWSSSQDSTVNPGLFTSDSIELVFNTTFDDTSTVSIVANGATQSLAPFRASVRFTQDKDSGVAYVVHLRCNGTFTDDLGVRHGPGLVRIFGRKNIVPVGSYPSSSSAQRRSVQFEGTFSGGLTFLGAYSL